MTWLAALALTFVTTPALAQDAAPPIDPSLPRVAIHTTAGDFTVAVEVVKAPITAANFLTYVDQKRLDGVVILSYRKGRGPISASCSSASITTPMRGAAADQA